MRPAQQPLGRLLACASVFELYNVAATLVSVPPGRHGDRGGPVRVLAAGVACFARLRRLRGHRRLQPAPGALPRARGHRNPLRETAEHAAVASLAPEHVRGSAFGVLAGVQSLANLAASAIAGLLYTVASRAAAFAYAAALMGRRSARARHQQRAMIAPRMTPVGRALQPDPLSGSAP